jgi:hypothetical protein
MKKDDLDIIKKVIEAEGMRRDIGLLIDQSVSVAPVESWWASLKGKIILITMTCAVVAVGGYYLNSSDGNEKEVVIAVTGNEIDTEDENIDSDKKIETLEYTGKQGEQFTDIKSQTAEIEPFKNLTIEDNLPVPQNTRNTARTSGSPISTRERTTPLNRNILTPGKNERPENQVSNLLAKANTKEGSKEGGEAHTSIPVVKKSNEVDSSVYKKVENHTFKKMASSGNNNSKQDTLTKSQGNGEKETVSIALGDSTGTSDDTDTAAISSSVSMKKWDVALGGGYAVVSTGDIRSITGNIDVNYRLSRKWALSGQTSFGTSTQPKREVDASFWQGAALAYFSPFGNTKKSDFRLGVGAGYYSIDHTFITSSMIIDGIEEIEYGNEVRGNMGYTLSIENRFSLNGRVLLGLGVYTNQYLNEDAVSGVKLNLGYAF